MVRKQPEFGEGIQRYWQFEFERQWSALRGYCPYAGSASWAICLFTWQATVPISRAIPISSAPDVVAGVPPD